MEIIGGDDMEKDEKERNYHEVMNAFLKSADDSTYSKEDVIEIVKAFQYKEALKELTDQKTIHKSVVLANSNRSRFLDPIFFRDLLLKFIFFCGVLILIDRWLYPDLFTLSMTPFVLAGVLALMTQLCRTLFMLVDFLTFSFHRVGLVSLLIYSGSVYVISNLIERDLLKVTFGQTMITVMIVLFVNGVIHHLLHRSMSKLDEIDDNFIEGSEDDE